MSILAGPRKKQKLSSDPRGLNWSNDSNKFGQKLMEKMGWEKGKGLGANEDGRQDHVSVNVKDDARGVGCSKSQADEWISHQDDFNSLLSQLNNSSSQAADESVQSLEKKSKSAKGRVHYQKFTKGKDLSSAKGNDLDCIFGRRKSEPSTPQTQSVDNSEAESDSDGPKQDNSHGVITVSSGTSIADYFAKKMAEMKARAAGSNTNASAEAVESKMESDSTDSNHAERDNLQNSPNVSEQEPDKVKRKKSKKKKKSQEKEIEEECVEKKAKKQKDKVDFVIGDSDDSEESKKELKKDKKRKKRDKAKDEEIESGTLEEEQILKNDDKKDKRHKKKRKLNDDSDCEAGNNLKSESNNDLQSEETEENLSTSAKKKKKKKKSKDNESSVVPDTANDSVKQDKAHGGKSNKLKLAPKQRRLIKAEKKKKMTQKDAIADNFKGANMGDVKGYGEQEFLQSFVN